MPETTTTPKLTAKLAQDLFGRKPGQTIRDFADELKALTETDRTELAFGFADGSLTYAK